MMEKTSFQGKLLKLIQTQELPTDPSKNLLIVKSSISQYVTDKLVAETLAFLSKEHLIDIREDEKKECWYYATEKSWWKGQLLEIPIDDIFIPPERVRSKLDGDKEKVMKESLKKISQIVPVIVRKTPLSNFKYRLVDGENRINILKELGKSRVLAMVIDNKLPDTTIQILTNYARGEIDQIELAKEIEKLLLKGYSSSFISEFLGYAPSTVRNLNYLNLLPPTVKELVKRKDITPEMAIEMRKKISSDAELVKVAKTVSRENWTLEKFREWSENEENNYTEIARPLNCILCRVPTGKENNGVWIRFCKSCWEEARKKIGVGKVDIHEMVVE